MPIKQIHHVTYRCKNAKETVEWYREYLDMDFILAFAEDHVPSTGELDPYMHVFLDVGNSNVLAFFELPRQPDMGRDPHTPSWVQHIAFEVADRDTLLAYKSRLEDQNIEVAGVIDHGLFHSIYFFDPNGHRLELTYRDANEAAKLERAQAVRWDMLMQWDATSPCPTARIMASQCKAER